MKRKTTDRKRGPVDIEAFMSQVPVWVSKLGNGSLFGKRKDKLILDILELGGMKLIETRCGMRFTREGEHPNCEPDMKTLLAIRQDLMKEQAEANLALAQRAGLAEDGGTICVMTVLHPKPGGVKSG
jgi:hypothetical protein